MGRELKNLEITPGGSVSISLPGKEPIKIGEIMEKTLVMKRNPEIHLMRQWNAYGINAQLVDKEIIDCVVIMETDGTNLFATTLDLKAHGRFYKGEDSEAEYYIDRNQMEKI